MRPTKPIAQNELFQDLGYNSLEPAESLSDSSTEAATGALGTKQRQYLETIERLDKDLVSKFRNKCMIHRSLTRQLVSFQANKQRAAYRWYKYKEAFSAPLVDYLLTRYEVSAGAVLDPFAGAGTALFAASDLGLNADGIELLPIGQEIIRARLLFHDLQPKEFERLRSWSNPSHWKDQPRHFSLPSLRITEGAYPKKNLNQIESFLSAISQEPEVVRTALRFALLCVLESVSYTRKDGQYLRWDYRSARRQGTKPFDKGEIKDFGSAICQKVTEILNDISSGSVPLALFGRGKNRGTVRVINGSCLELLPSLPSATYDAILTSPPYCNRYDYTRTYALELALLGIGEDEIAKLRQEMLSCTVENRAKGIVSTNPAWQNAIQAADENHLLQAILAYLDWCRQELLLNNNGIARMVRGYFYEMACVIAECNRLLKPGAVLLMVNDNVRYAGASVSVDLILSTIAERLGFSVENILVLPDGKGNSSQQMGTHGRDVLRKCVYVWRKHLCHTAVT